MELVEGYGWVVIVLILHLLENIWMARQVGNARKKYKVFYPTMYALESENPKADLFNCVQRAHQNVIEFMPTFVSTLLVGGLQYPRVAAVFGLVYIILRYAYFKGYSTGDPQKRFAFGG
jgi:glutathione S-transferase